MIRNKAISTTKDNRKTTTTTTTKPSWEAGNLMLGSHLERGPAKFVELKI